ncbi:DNA repair and recombination protein RAD54B [Neolecta irregularis DAH-3]|uniref:DNA repair and recombination protein RAD54B n=1 Tax=Neolecta irregularis (strain DAH-3) TaxID=1198029 RepID=A0A1U7LNI6_NEOID|nr:DNA repair and recombination protein RAD54B [Neolecta irregularis DAH-3]|eukprot:OLL24153.1 DNA repair and recombination protein RAD54B [Neolecta irregularis DAH-3]
MIIGYEKLRLVQDDLKKANIDIIICDEGHRLKSANNKSAQAIRALNTPRRVILSGTPIQNDLGEFFVMVDFVNPGICESYATFKKEFENPIIKSRQPEARKKDKEKGKARSEQLASLTSLFILRRTADILSKYLPPKAVEYVVFCKPTKAQIALYSGLLESSSIRQCISGTDSPTHVLQAITSLKKLCNCPSLIMTKASEGDSSYTNLAPIIDKYSSSITTSGKLAVLDHFLQRLKKETDEKIVLVSNYTQTLDILQDLLNMRGMSFLRLDGSTAKLAFPYKALITSTKRQEYVDRFNRTNREGSFAFLLSSKSGGVGLNLIGASRLILFDTDWNPSVDLQAMARVHRDGQKRQVYIYRFLTTGMMDEKIYQRQITKQGLSDSFMDAKANSSGNSFSLSELRDLFTFHENTSCHTHDLLGCTCLGKGEKPIKEELQSDENDLEDELLGFIPASQAIAEIMPPRNNQMNALNDYLHILPQELNESELEELVEDDILNSVMRDTDSDSGHCKISYLFVKYSATPTEDSVD